MNKKVISQTFVDFFIRILTFLSIPLFKIKYGYLTIRKNTSDLSVFTSVFLLKELQFSIDLKLKFIIVEFHDRIKEGCSSSLYNAINMDEWNEFKKGEKSILRRKVLLSI